MKKSQMALVMGLALAGWALTPAVADATAKCSVTTPMVAKGEEPTEKNLCHIPLEEMHPAQPSVGMLAVMAKRDKFMKKIAKDYKNKDTKKIDEYFEESGHWVPLAIGPTGKFYIADRHHLSTGFYYALKEMKGDTNYKMKAYVKKHYSWDDVGKKDDWDGFWNKMNQEGMAYLQDYQDGQWVTLNGQQMNKIEHVSQLSDNPYRTLSRWVRNGNGYVKPVTGAMYFMEFFWGAYMADQSVSTTVPGSFVVCKYTGKKRSDDCMQQAKDLRNATQAAFAKAAMAEAANWMQDKTQHLATKCETAKDSMQDVCGFNPFAHITKKQVKAYISGKGNDRNLEDYLEKLANP